MGVEYHVHAARMVDSGVRLLTEEEFVCPGSASGLYLWYEKDTNPWWTIDAKPGLKYHLICVGGDIYSWGEVHPKWPLEFACALDKDVVIHYYGKDLRNIILRSSVVTCGVLYQRQTKKKYCQFTGERADISFLVYDSNGMGGLRYKWHVTFDWIRQAKVLERRRLKCRGCDLVDASACVIDIKIRGCRGRQNRSGIWYLALCDSCKERPETIKIPPDPDERWIKCN